MKNSSKNPANFLLEFFWRLICRNLYFIRWYKIIYTREKKIPILRRLFLSHQKTLACYRRKVSTLNFEDDI